MTTPLFLGLSAEHATAVVVKGLAVGGAFLVGYVLAGLVTFGLERWVVKRKAASPLKRVIRLFGGVAAAILAALLLFGDGGDGPGGGPGTGTATVSTSASPTPAPVAPAPPTAAPAERDQVRVTVRGGAIPDGTFYRLDDGTAHTFESLTAALRARQRLDGRKLELLIAFPDADAPARDLPIVKRLESWAIGEGGMAVKYDPRK